MLGNQDLPQSQVVLSPVFQGFIMRIAQIKIIEIVP
ncbi:MAG: hypothetical protein PWQ18_325 [Clostridia bacterium]|nr:hypothetical protein [Clostridia bacterium]